MSSADTEVPPKQNPHNEALIRASENGLVKEVQSALEAKADIEAISGKHNDTALVLAAWKGHVEVVNILIAAKAVIDAPDGHGHTALMVATWDTPGGNQHLAVIQKLLEANADITKQDEYGQTVFVHAVNRKTFKLLATDNVKIALSDKGVRLLISQGRITINQLLLLTWEARHALCDAGVRAFIIEGRITIEQVLGITWPAMSALCEAGVRDLIIEKRIRMDQVLKLTEEASTALCSEEVRALISKNILMIEEMLALTEPASRALCAGLYDFFSQHRKTIKHILRLTEEAANALRISSVRGFITQGQIKIEEVLKLTRAASRVLCDPEVVDFISKDARIPMRQVLTLTWAASYALCNPGVRDFITKGGITIKQVLSLTEDAGYILSQEEIRDFIAKGVITLEQALTLTLDEASALRDERVINFIAKDRLTQKGLWAIAKAAEDTLSNSYAPIYTVSPLAIAQALALADEEWTILVKGGLNERRTGELSFEQIIDPLHQMQATVLAPIITHKTPGFRLIKVLREEANRYLQTLANPKTAKELLVFTDLIVNIKKNGTKVIWPFIVEQVTTRMFDEFGSLYSDKADPQLTALIHAGKNVDLGALPDYQEQIQGSKGYQQFCSRALSSSQSFFPATKDLIAHRLVIADDSLSLVKKETPLLASKKGKRRRESKEGEAGKSGKKGRTQCDLFTEAAKQSEARRRKRKAVRATSSKEPRKKAKEQQLSVTPTGII